MNLFDYYVYIPFMRFHLLTALILLFQLTWVTYITRRYREWSIVYGTLSVTLAIHLYEIFHGVFHYAMAGVVGVSLWRMNIPLTILMFLLLYTFDKRYPTITNFPIASMFCFQYFIVCMIIMASINFFETFKFNIWWALSKVLMSLTVTSLFWRYKP